jgi:hypothetical protein
MTEIMNVEQTNVKQQGLLLVYALLCGLICDYLFYGKEFGVSYPLFVCVFYALYFWGLRSKLAFHWGFEWLLLIPICLLSLTYALFANPAFQVLNALFIPVLIAAQTYLAINPHKRTWISVPLIGRMLDHVMVQSFRHFGTAFLTVGLLLPRNRTDTSQYRTLFKVLLGLLISLPLLLVVIALLASADTVFAQAIRWLPRLLDNIRMGELLVRGFWIIVLSLLLFGYLWGLLNPRHRGENEKYDGDADNGEEAPQRLYMDPVVVTTVLIVVNLVYVMFTAIQFSYFFAAHEGILPAGINYAEYARRGFMELVVVTVINFNVLLASIRFLRRDNSSLYLMIKIMLTLLIGCTLVMLFSAFSRLSLYETAYGYTYIRLLVHAFMIFLGILLLLAFYKIWRERSPLHKQYIVVALVAYVIVNYMNIDAIITENNIQRYKDSGKIDAAYLGRLSYDAVPLLVQLIKEQQKQEMGNQLSWRVGLQDQLRRKRDMLNEEQTWQSANAAKSRARRALLDME